MRKKEGRAARSDRRPERTAAPGGLGLGDLGADGRREREGRQFFEGLEGIRLVVEAVLEVEDIVRGRGARDAESVLLEAEQGAAHRFHGHEGADAGPIADEDDVLRVLFPVRAQSALVADREHGTEDAVDLGQRTLVARAFFVRRGRFFRVRLFYVRAVSLAFRFRAAARLFDLRGGRRNLRVHRGVLSLVILSVRGGLICFHGGRIQGFTAGGGFGVRFGRDAHVPVVERVDQLRVVSPRIVAVHTHDPRGHRLHGDLEFEIPVQFAENALLVRVGIHVDRPRADERRGGGALRRVAVQVPHLEVAEEAVGSPQRRLREVLAQGPNESTLDAGGLGQEEREALRQGFRGAVVGRRRLRLSPYGLSARGGA